MKVFLPPLEIGETEGFRENDIFDREQFADGLKSLLSTATDPLVIALDGQWGSGKTTFLKMWAGELRRAGFPVVFFDAFSNDYMQDAFVAIAAQIVSLVEEKKSASGKTSDFIEKAAKVGKIVARSGLKIGIKLASLGALTSDDIQLGADTAREISKEISEIEDKYIGEIITRHKEEKALIENFISSLAELPGLLQEDTETKKPLIFIVDELDRCRPTFALEILERIKHFFATENIHFVFGLSMDQISESVKLTYGQGVNPQLYLEKFFNLRVHLGFNQNQNIHLYKAYIIHLFKQHELTENDSSAYFMGFLSFYAEKKAIGLRTTERIMSKWILGIGTNSRLISPLSIAIFAGLAILSVTEPSLYEAIKRNEATPERVAESLFLEKSDDWPIPFTRDIWSFATGGKASPEVQAHLSSYSRDPHRLIRDVIQGLLEKIVPMATA